MISATASTICSGRASDPVSTMSSAEVVTALQARVGHPADPLEHLRFDVIADDLAWFDGNAAADLLDQPMDRFGGAYGQLMAYLLVVLAEAEFARHGWPLVGRERLLRTICEQTGNEFKHLPPYLSTLFLVPATERDRHAAHVGALLLNSCGEASRPWLKPTLPDHGHFLIIGTPVATATTHPFVAHHRCDGTSDFANLAIHSPAFC